MNKILSNSAIISAAIIVALASSGCAPRIGANNVSIQGAGQMSQTLRGKIVGARPVTISASSTESDNQPGAGALIGALGGGLLGSQIGQGKGSVLAGVAGAAAGGVGGHLLGQKLTDQEGMEYQVQLDRGDLVTMRQGADPMFHVGQRVMVVDSGRGQGRVIPDNS